MKELNSRASLWITLCAEHNPECTDPWKWLQLATALQLLGLPSLHALARAAELGASAKCIFSLGGSIVMHIVAHSLRLSGMEDEACRWGESANANLMDAATNLSFLKLDEPDDMVSLVVDEADLLSITSISPSALRLQFAVSLIRLGLWSRAEAILLSHCKLAASHLPLSSSHDSWAAICVNELIINADKVPRVLLIESRSLPRSGHHYLKSVLQSNLGDKFSYCEYYQEPGCCKRKPCLLTPFLHYALEHGCNHVRLVKSHDLDLLDPAYTTPSGVIRFVQVRRPSQLLASWLELIQLTLNVKLLASKGVSTDRIFLLHESLLKEEAWRIVDNDGVVMESSGAAHWLKEQAVYVVRFLKKWLPLCMPLTAALGDPPVKGSFVLRYEDLGRYEDLLLGIAGLQGGVSKSPRFHPTRTRKTDSCSLRVTKLLQSQSELIDELEREILLELQPYSSLLEY
ncbi:MAG: hypothetical protein ACKPBV_18380 [Sphaerospermopsis kisseleviana]